MNGKSPETACFYAPATRSDGGRETFESLPTTASPWGPDSQHGGPPAALLARAIEGLTDAVRRPVHDGAARPGPGGPLAVSAEVVRPGRTVQLAAAELYDVARGRRGRDGPGLAVPGTRPTGPSPTRYPPPHSPDDGVEHDRPAGLGRRLPRRGRVALDQGRGRRSPGPAWSGCARTDLVQGEPISPLQRLLACADSASGASSVLDPREWGVPQHRADRARPPPARGRVDPARRRDHPVDRLGRAWPRRTSSTAAGWSPGRTRPCWSQPLTPLAQSWIRGQGAAPRARRPARAGSPRGRRRRRTSSRAAARRRSWRAGRLIAGSPVAFWSGVKATQSSSRSMIVS